MRTVRWWLIIGSCFHAMIAFSQSYVHERSNPGIKVKPVVALKAYAFNLRDVRLLEGSPFKNAMDKDAVSETGKFFDVEYPITMELLKGKTKVVVKIQAHPDRTTGRVFSPRILKKK